MHKATAVFSVDDTSIRAHRFSYEHHNGAIPEGLVVRHKCDNRACVEPSHLELGTTADNNADMVMRGRLVSRPGSEKTNAKLTETLVVQLLFENAAGIPRREIAKKYGIAQSTLGYIITGKRWKHVARMIDVACPRCDALQARLEALTGDVGKVEKQIRLSAYASAGDPKRSDDTKMFAIWSGFLQAAIASAIQATTEGAG